MKDFTFPIEPAAREWKRQFANVVRSFAKTVTEAVTNADTSYKRLHHLPDASGLVELMLAVAKGTRLDSAALKARLPKTTEREIQIHLYTARGHLLPAKTCDIVDLAEGLSPEEVSAAFREFAANKTQVSKGRPGRSLFGRGVSDVLLGHKGGELYSYKDGTLTHAQFIFDGRPHVKGKEVGKPSNQDLASLHLRKDRNGTCVRFALSEDCPLPDEGTAIPLLSRFYMLRLINSDPNVAVRVFRYRAGGKVYEDTLDYDFPIGDVIGRFSSDFDVPAKMTKKDFPPLRVEAIVCRADVDGRLKGRESRDARENGLLFTDEKDAVLDLTFLPEFEGAPYLNKIFGVVRISGIRAVLEHFLDSGLESPLTTTRDGFDTRHEFSQALFAHLKKHLEPIYRKEEEHHNKASSTELSAEATKRLNEAMRQLNKYLSELLGPGEDGEDAQKDAKDVALQFVPSATKAIVGQLRFVTLLLRQSDAKPKGAIMIDSSNPRVEVYPTLIQIDKGKVTDKFLAYRVSLKCDGLHETATITALADGREGTLEAKLELLDVIAASIVEPPIEMEFRPTESKGQPNRKNSAALYVNLQAIPLGRKIEVSIVKSQGGIALLEESGKKGNQLALRLELSHQIAGTSVARVPVPWIGGGWGQFARVMAETKTPAGKVVTAMGTVTIDQEEEGGLIKDIKYRDLGNQKCSDLVDGIIYINSGHALNSAVFGPTQEDYKKSVDADRTAQYRLCSIVTEQSVFRLAEDWHLKNKLLILQTAPVTSIREFVDAKTHEFAPKLLKILVTAD